MIGFEKRLTILSDITEGSSKEKRLAKHRRYNMSYKGHVRYQKYDWKRNKLRLEKRIKDKQEQINILEMELKEWRKKHL